MAVPVHHRMAHRLPVGRNLLAHAPDGAPLEVGTQRATHEVLLSLGEGELVTLPVAVANVWTSNPEVADVYVDNARQIHLFGKSAGEATVFASTASGAVAYAAKIRVSQNISSIDKLVKMA
ncbi:MAG: pilus assembly protein N-terminal domain-containing protein, partial [Sphingomonadales bacterium]|nr:pilus assembly protein N-terminal domain-containing protein [Sphingomonadales bacterium]